MAGALKKVAYKMARTGSVVLRPLIWLLLFLAPLSFAKADHSCFVSPFSKTIKQGESVLYTVNLSGHSPSTDYELRLGGLPRQVTSGFVTPPSATSTQASVVFKTNDDSQTGSLGLSLIYKVQSGTISEEAICQLNLIIEEKQKIAPTLGGSVPGVPSGAQASSSPDALLDVPTDLLLSIGTKEVKNASTTRATTPPSVFTDPSRPMFEKHLSSGMRGDIVVYLQDVLRSLGFFPKEIPSTGYFGPITKKAVTDFQESNGIETIGVVGPKTRGALNNL